MCEINILWTLSLVFFNFFLSLNADYTQSEFQLPITSFQLPSKSPKLRVQKSTLDSKAADDRSLGTCVDYDISKPSIFKYKVGEVHSYKIESITSINLPNSLKGETTKLSYVGRFELAAESPCSFRLRVSNIEIVGPDGKKRTDPALSRYPARFTWNNGRLNELYLNQDESSPAANVKRSIITSLQVSSLGTLIEENVSDEESTIMETDIYGNCMATVRTMKDKEDSLTMMKNKNLNGCKNRPGLDFVIKSTSDESDELLQTNPFVDANLRSVTKIGSGIIRSVFVEEIYNYQAFSKYSDTETKVVVITKISYAGRNKNGFTSDFLSGKLSSLFFEAPKSREGSATNAVIVKALQEASFEEEDGTLPVDVIDRYSKLVSVLQQAKKQDILTTYAQVKSGAGFVNKNEVNVVFWDSIISAGTPETVETAATLLANGEMPPDKISDFAASLPFVKHPIKETLAAVSFLVEGPETSADKKMSVGSLINSFIKNNPNEKVPELSMLIEKLADSLQKYEVCRTVEEEDMVIGSLKGIQNAKFVTPNVAELIRNVAQNKRNSNRVRASALQTMMLNVSDALNNKVALEVLTNVSEDSELRIRAFQFLITSPSSTTAETVRKLLDFEPDSQTGRYIKSYLRNLRLSKDPKKETLKQYYENIDKIDLRSSNFLQDSYNYEFSHLLSAMKLGYVCEGDILFSPRSYLPRSTSLSLNTKLFGKSVNLFELGARFENVEYVVEKLIGPRSYLRTNSAEDIADDLTMKAKSFFGATANNITLRENIKHGVENKHKIMANNRSKQEMPQSDSYLNLDFSIKMFDSEKLWSSYHKPKFEIFKELYLDSLQSTIEETVQNTKNINVDYKKHYRHPVISNNAIYYPTSAGFPIKLSVNAISAVSFKMNTNFDVKETTEKPQNSNVRLLIRPSATIQIEGTIEVEASVISTGLKGTTSVRSSTGMDVGLQLLDGSGFDLKFILPVKEQDLITMKTEAFAIMQDIGQLPIETSLKPAGRRYEYIRKFDQLALVTGVSFATEASFPAFSYKPTLSPSRLSLRLVKEDESLKYYSAKVAYNNNDSYRSFELLLDTPGSKVNRKLAFFVEANKAENKYAIKYEGWSKKVSIEANVTNKDDDISLNINMTNDEAEYFVKLGVSITNDVHRIVYKPYCILKTPYNSRDISLDKMRLVPKVHPKLFHVEGSVVRQKKRNKSEYREYEINQLTLTSPYGILSASGLIRYDLSVLHFDTNLTIGYGNKNNIVLQSYLNYPKESTENNKTEGLLMVIPSQWPLNSFKLVLQEIRTLTSSRRILNFVHGPDLNSSLMKISFEDAHEWTINSENGIISKANRSTTVSYPLLKLNVKMKSEELNNNYYKNEVKMTINKSIMMASGTLGIGNRNPGNIDFQFKTSLNERSFDVNVLRDLVGTDKSKILININPICGKQVTVKMNVTHRLESENTLINAVSVIRIQPDNTLYRHEIGATYTSREKSAHLAMYANDEKTLEIQAGYVIVPSYMKGGVILYLRNVIDGVATIQESKPKLNGTLNLNFLQSNRLITGKLDLISKNEKLREGSMELLWDASNDATKKISVVTSTNIFNRNLNVTIINSKNTVYYLDQVLQIDADISLDSKSDADDVKIKLNLILPNGSVCVGELSCSKQVENNVFNLKMNSYYSVTKNHNPIAILYNIQTKGIDMKKFIFDVKTDLVIATVKTPKMELHIGARRMLQDKKWNIGGNVSLDGSIVKNKLKCSIDTEYSEGSDDDSSLISNDVSPAKFDLFASAGDDYVMYYTGNISKTKLNHKLQLKLPLKNTSTTYEQLPRVFTMEWVTKSKLEIQPSVSIKALTSNKIVWDKVQFANWNAAAEILSQKGRIALETESSDFGKRSIKMNYNYGDKQIAGLNGTVAEVGINLTFDENPTNCLFKTEFSKDLTVKSVMFTSYNPTKGKMTFNGTSKWMDDGHSKYNEMSLKTDANHWFISSLINTYPTKPAVDLLYVSPEGKSHVNMKMDEISVDHWIVFADVSLQHGLQGYLNGSGELKLNSANDLKVKAKLDSTLLGINNFSFATISASDAVKKIYFTIKSSDVTLYSGSVSYSYLQDAQTLQIEGTGFIKMQDNKSYPITFKFNRQQLIELQNGEVGNLNQFYLNLNNKKYVLDLEAKFTEQGFLLKRDYWREGKLHRLDIVYDKKISEGESYQTSFVAHFDYEPGATLVIEGNTTTTPSSYDSRLTMEYANDRRIDYNLYSTSAKSGITLTLPSRQIAAEVVHSYKLDLKEGNAKLTGNLWFDKQRDASQKLMIAGVTEYKLPDGKNTFVSRSTAGVQIPALSKTLKASTGVVVSLYDEKTLEITSELDIFKKHDQRINITYQVFKSKQGNGYMFSDMLKITSKKQKMDLQVSRSTIFYFDHLEYHWNLSYLNYQQKRRTASVDLIISLLSINGKVDIFKTLNMSGSAEINFGKNFIQLKQNIDILGHPYETTSSLTTDPKFIFTVESKGKVKQKITVTAVLLLRQYFNVQAELVNRGQFADYTLFLNKEKFLKSEIKLILPVANALVENGKTDVNSLFADGKKATKSVMNEVSQQLNYRVKVLHNTSIDMKPVLNEANNYLKAIKDEIKNDTSLMSASENVQKIINYVVEGISLMIQQVSNFLGEWIQGYNEMLDKIKDLTEKTLLNINHLMELSVDDVSEWLSQQLNELTEMMKDVIEYIKANKDRWQEMLTVALGSLQEYVRIITDVSEQILRDIKDFYGEAITYLKFLPITSYLKEKFDQIRNSQPAQYLWSVICDSVYNLRDILPTQEMKDLFDAIVATLNKVFKDEPYDLQTELGNICKKLVNCLQSLVSAVGNLNYIRNLGDIAYKFLIYPDLSFVSLNSLINAWNSINSWCYLPNLNLLSMDEFMEKYLTGNMNFQTSIFSNRKVGAIINGKEIITLNENYYTIDSNCEYLLAADMENSNFTVTGIIANGQMERVAITSNFQTIELYSDMKVTLNKVPSDYPVNGNGLYAERTPYLVIVHVDESLQVECTPDLQICIFVVSSFYFNKVYGLLGTVSFDSRTDFTMPDMTIAEDLSTFIKSYQLKKECKESSSVLATTLLPASSECNAIIYDISMLRSGIKPYINLCEKLVASSTTPTEKLDAVCKAASAFSLVHNSYWTLPPECGKCHVDKNTVPIGYTTNLQTRGNAAEILVILEKTSNNEILYKELLMNSMKLIRNLMKEKGIDDLNFVLVGYGPADKNPSIHTTKGKLEFNEQTKIEFSNLSYSIPSSTLGRFIRSIKHSLGWTNATRALEIINEYPFKADAAYAVIEIKGSVNDSFSNLKLYNIFNTLINNMAMSRIVQNKIPVVEVYSIHSVTSTEGTDQTTVFGADMNNVYTTEGSKLYQNGILDKLNYCQQYLKVNGAVFNSSVFKESQPDVRDRLTNTFANVVYNSVLSNNGTSTCTCKYRGIHQEMQCSLLSTVSI